MIQDVYDVSKGDRARVVRAMRAEEAVRRAWLALEELEDAQAREAARRQETKRKIKGGLAAFAVSALGVGVFIGLALVWGRR
ncbi:MAG: hypothetical protein IT381_28300 [Deltaproteobacteria bacterium]|nr:hypothetical protein [Deltaproteobacteria bacterium]